MKRRRSTREDELSGSILREFVRLERLIAREPAIARAVVAEDAARLALRMLRGA